MINRRTICLYVMALCLAAPSCLTAGEFSWGQLRTVAIPAAILSERGLESRKVGMIQPGEWVKAAFTGNNWTAVFPKDVLDRDEDQALGYVYTPLLKHYSEYMTNIWSRDTENDPGEHPFISLSEELCKLSYNFDHSALSTLLPQLSRVNDLYTDDLPGMMDRRIIRILTTYSMSTYFISDGQGHGFEYSLLKDFEDFLNRKSGGGSMRTVLEFIPVPEGLLQSSLLNGIGDIVAAGVAITPEHEAAADFSLPYLTDISEVLVTRKSQPPISDISDLAGRKIHVLPGKDSSKTLRRINAHLIVRGLKPLTVIPVSGYLTREDVLELVDAGYIDLTLAESHVAKLWAEYLPGLVIEELPGISDRTEIAWMVRKDNPLLRESLNEFLSEHRKGTFNWNLYYNRYFLSARWSRNPLHPALQEIFSEYAPLFRKYGARYRFDWMLLAAVAFQESGLNHHRVSDAGAVGLMQVLPATAHDLDIEVDSVDNLETNVHAAARYLSLLRDVYFSDPEIPPEARIRMILAAYNAGPSRIQQCRRVAARLGYDPNRWFYNTEMVAMKLIGPETVEYVSNVKKYYMAYSLSQTMECLRDKHIADLKAAIDLYRTDPAPFVSP
ncbi:MAG: transglycosylase SLT domain-containing protein [Desulfobacterales bacterium]